MIGVERHTARECVGTGLELGINAHLVDALREVSRIGNQTGFRKLLSDDLGTSTFGHRDRGLLTLGQKLDRLRGTAVEQGERAPRQTSDDENGQNGGDYSRSLAFLRAGYSWYRTYGTGARPGHEPSELHGSDAENR